MLLSLLIGMMYGSLQNSSSGTLHRIVSPCSSSASPSICIQSASSCSMKCYRYLILTRTYCIDWLPSGTSGFSFM